jgi:hypothetical protein
MTKEISIGHILTRDAMKNLKGGKAYPVNCTTSPGYTQTSPGSCSGTRANCQKEADNYCANTAGCVACSLD